MWLVTPDFLVFLPWTPNLATLVPKPGTRKPATPSYNPPSLHHLAELVKSLAGSSSGAAPSVHGHEAGAGRSLPTLGPGAGWRSAGHPELARPGGNPVASPSIAHVPLMKMGPPRRPGGLRGPLGEDSGGVWLGAHPVAGAPDPTADGGRAGGSQQLPVANRLAYEDLKQAIL